MSIRQGTIPHSPDSAPYTIRKDRYHRRHDGFPDSYTYARDRPPIKTKILLGAMILFTAATIMAFLESIGGSTASPLRKQLAIASFASSSNNIYYILIDGICSPDFKDDGCASLASFARSSEGDKALYALFLALNSLSWIHNIAAAWALLATVVLTISFFHQKHIYTARLEGYEKHETTEGIKKEMRRQGVQYQKSQRQVIALHPLTKLAFCFASCVLSLSVAMIAVGQHLWCSTIIESMEKSYTKRPPAGLILALFAFICEAIACFMVTRQSENEISEMIEGADRPSNGPKLSMKMKTRAVMRALS